MPDTDDYIDYPTLNSDNKDQDLPKLDLTSDEASDWIHSFGNTHVEAIPVNLDKPLESVDDDTTSILK